MSRRILRRTSSLIGSCANSESQRSAGSTGQSEPNRTLSWMIEFAYCTSSLEKYFGAGSAKRDGEGLVVNTGTQPIRYLDRKGYTARYPGVSPVRPGDHPALLSVRVDSLSTCEALLKQNGVTFVKPEAARLIVPPDQAAHLTIEFAER